MLLMIILVLVGLMVWLFIWYGIVWVITRVLYYFTKAEWLIRKKLTIPVAVGIAALVVAYMIWMSPPRNFKTAYIQKEPSDYVITVRGKRTLMVHDPVSALLPHDYKDSCIFNVPRQIGELAYNEIRTADTNIHAGTLTIDGRKMTVNLYYDSAQRAPYSWNGDYKLKYR